MIGSVVHKLQARPIREIRLRRLEVLLHDTADNAAKKNIEPPKDPAKENQAPPRKRETVQILLPPSRRPPGWEAPGWDRHSYKPDSQVRGSSGGPGGPDDALAQGRTTDDALAQGRAIFSISPARGKAEAVAVGEFFRRFPSRAANQIAFFHSMWAQLHKFEDNPLRGYLYHNTVPIDAEGRPKNGLWQAYADASVAGLPSPVVESAFIAAHVSDFKAVLRKPDFKRLYALASDEYRKVVEAYLDALQQFEGDLAIGKDPDQVARKMSWDTGIWLSRWKARHNGLETTWIGMRHLMDPTQPGTRQFWRAFWEIGTGLVFDARPRRPAPTHVATDLTTAEAANLKELTGIPFRPGRQVVSARELAQGVLSEPDRREVPGSRPLRQYAMLPEDFLAPQKLRKGLPMSGRDGRFSAAEVESVIRNVQARARSQLVQEFFDRYPVPAAGILIYSANMLAFNGAYGQSPMFGSLANAIMPVDNDGNPKNALWQAYADAYESRKRDGHSSTEAIEALWFRAHMKDFEIVDTPNFRKELAHFWHQSAHDKTLAPMATYTQAMVGGRKVFEEATREQVSDDVAFARSLNHFGTTVASSGSFPFWEHDLREAWSWLKNRSEPKIDARGLPTDTAMFERAAKGVAMMVGLIGTLRRAGKASRTKTEARLPATGMVDLARVLDPEALAQVDPQVLAFYRDPRSFVAWVGVDYRNQASQLIMGKVDAFLAGMGKAPDRIKGFENYPLEMDLYRDSVGGTHWDRFVVVDGKRQNLFAARFEVQGRNVVETFRVRGEDVRLVFDVSPYRNGVRLVLNPKKSSFVLDSNIVFTTTPTPEGLKTVGTYRRGGGLLSGTIEFHIKPKVAAKAG